MPTRRAFVVDLGKGAAAALLVTACGPAETITGSTASTATTAAPATSPDTTGSPAVDATAAAVDAVTWSRVNLGFVSAYVLTRGGEAALVDTGVDGSERAIEEVLASLGLGWNAVGHVILTHGHPDHVGSVRAVLESATGATGYIGEADLPNVSSPRPLTSVADGDTVFGLRIVGTPGHTAGHVSVLDPGRLLVAGDAINGFEGVSGPNPRFTADLEVAIESVVLLGTLEYDTAVFGHGEPLEGDAAAQVAAMAAGLS